MHKNGLRTQTLQLVARGGWLTFRFTIIRLACLGKKIVVSPFEKSRYLLRN